MMPGWLFPLVGGAFLLLAAVAMIFFRHTRKVATTLEAEVSKRDRIAKELAEVRSNLEVRIEQRTKELRGSEARFRTILDHAPIGIFLKDTKGRYIYSNKQNNDWYGLSNKMVAGKVTADFFPPEVAKLSRESDARVIETGEVVKFEVDYPLPNGELQHCLVVKVPVLDDVGNLQGTVGMVLDNSERWHAEEALEINQARLRQSQKMEAVGQLTGGVAHEFNNLLQVIAGHMGLLENSIPESATSEMSFQAIHRSVTRGSELTDRLLSFSRQQPLVPRAVVISEVLAKMRDMLARTLGATIDIATDQKDDVWVAKADPDQLDNALLNLALNARDAMPGGVITLSAANVRIDEAQAATHEEATPGDYVVVSVADNGDGMTEQDIGHAFEPFFTTKDVGEGTGLGLSMVYGFAQQSGGFAEIESELGVGTTVRLYLPRQLPREEDQEAGVRDATPETAPPGSGTILLVEDNQDVLMSLAAQLTNLGYRVIEAEDGAAALAVLADEQQIDLLFTDVVMPGELSGLELARKILLLRPGLKVLYTTGYSEEIVSEAGRLLDNANILRKPYDRTKLAVTISEILK